MPKPEQLLQDHFVSTAEAAVIAEVNERTVRRWFDDGLIGGEAVAYGDRIVRRVSYLSLKAYLSKRESEAGQRSG